MTVQEVLILRFLSDRGLPSINKGSRRDQTVPSRFDTTHCLEMDTELIVTPRLEKSKVPVYPILACRDSNALAVGVTPEKENTTAEVMVQLPKPPASKIAVSPMPGTELPPGPPDESDQFALFTQLPEALATQ